MYLLVEKKSVGGLMEMCAGMCVCVCTDCTIRACRHNSTTTDTTRPPAIRTHTYTQKLQFTQIANAATSSDAQQCQHSVSYEPNGMVNKTKIQKQKQKI